MYTCTNHRVNTEWQWPISGVHSIMMEKSALAGEGVEARALFFILLTSCTRCSVRSSWEGRYMPQFHLYTPICTLRYKLTINAPMIYTAPCIMFWMHAYPLRRQEEVGPWNLRVFWALWNVIEPIGFMHKSPRGRSQGPYWGGWRSRCIKELDRPALAAPSPIT